MQNKDTHTTQLDAGQNKQISSGYSLAMRNSNVISYFCVREILPQFYGFMENIDNCAVMFQDSPLNSASADQNGRKRPSAAFESDFLFSLYEYISR